jgi:hypothetical protein
VSVPGEIDGDASPRLGSHFGNDLTPQEAVGEDAVDEYRGATLPNVEITDGTRSGCGVRTMGVQCRALMKTSTSVQARTRSKSMSASIASRKGLMLTNVWTGKVAIFKRQELTAEPVTSER